MAAAVAQAAFLRRDNSFSAKTPGSILLESSSLIDIEAFFSLLSCRFLDLFPCFFFPAAPLAATPIVAERISSTVNEGEAPSKMEVTY
jgi:hypothetical protein